MAKSQESFMFTVGKLGEHNNLTNTCVTFTKDIPQMLAWLYALVFWDRVLSLTTTGVDSARRASAPHRVPFTLAATWGYDRLYSEHIRPAQPRRREETRGGVLDPAK